MYIKQYWITAGNYPSQSSCPFHQRKIQVHRQMYDTWSLVSRKVTSLKYRDRGSIRLRVFVQLLWHTGRLLLTQIGLWVSSSSHIFHHKGPFPSHYRSWSLWVWCTHSSEITVDYNGSLGIYVPPQIHIKGKFAPIPQGQKQLYSYAVYSGHHWEYSKYHLPH